MVKRFAVIGLGYFGSNIARELTRQGAEVIAIDNTLSKVEEIKDEVAYAVRLDSTDEKTLRNQGLEDLDGVIVSIGEDFESALLTCVLLLEFGCRNVIVKSTSPIHTRIFKSVGVQNIVAPDLAIAERLAVSLVSANILDTIPLTDDYSIIQIRAPRFMVGQTLQGLNLRGAYDVNLITIKRERTAPDDIGHRETIIGVPRPDTVIEKHDVLILMGSRKSIERLGKE
ncbi:MAG: TrkA family potassium uptake protein [Bacteroidota bacterium]|jgi:trk system potassium uptake protein TrkA|nr:TrkA family potassium uptake protein [Bacteroidota bacterium]